MSYLMIATVYNEGKLVGYRILNTETKETVDAQCSSVIKALKGNGNAIENIALKYDDEIVGTNGAINRYTKCDLYNNVLAGTNSAMVIINKFSDGGFTACNYIGQIVELSDDDALRFAKTVGIANGKVTNNNNKDFISAINGNYKTVESSREIKFIQRPMRASSLSDGIEAKEVKETSSKKIDTSIFDIYQREAINTYYDYLINKRDESLTEDELRQIAKNEISDIVDVLKNNTLEYCYKLNTNILNCVMRLDTVENMYEIMNEQLAKSIVSFIKYDLPIPESMSNIIFKLLKYHTKECFSAIYKSYDSVIELIFDNKSNKLNASAIKLIDGICDDKTDKDYFGALDKILDVIDKLSKFGDKIEIKLKELNIELTNAYAFSITKDESYKDIRYAFEYGSHIIKIDDYTKIAKVTDTAYEQGIHLRVKEFIESFMESRPSRDYSSISKIFTEAEKVKEQENIADSSVKKNIEQIEDAEIEISGGDTADEGYQYSTIKPNDMTKTEWLQFLLDKNTVDEKDYSIVIAKDILKRKLNYDTLSSKQKFRIDEAIKICLSANFKRLGLNKSNEDEHNKKEISTDENVDYILSDNPDIKEKVERIIKKSDDVEMQAVLKETPNVIKICYSILKYNKATTKQLRHVNLAIEILDKQ